MVKITILLKKRKLFSDLVLLKPFSLLIINHKCVKLIKVPVVDYNGGISNFDLLDKRSYMNSLPEKYTRKQ